MLTVRQFRNDSSSFGILLTGAIPRVDVPLETPSRIVQALAEHGYNAEREAVTLLAGADDPAAALETVVEITPDDALRVTTATVRQTLEPSTPAPDPAAVATDSSPSANTPVSTLTKNPEKPTTTEETP